MSFVPPRPEMLTVEGPAGPLEAIVEVPAGFAGERAAVVCHPHPLFGGTMNNKVVHTAARALQEAGYATLRFNFRGVGASPGAFDDGLGETDDALAAFDHVRARWPAASVSVAGFSFGSFVAWRVAAQRSVRELILISPPVARFEFGATQARPTVVIQGDVDDVVLASDVASWVAGLSPVPPLATVNGAGHFFHGHLAELRQAVQAAVR